MINQDDTLCFSVEAGTLHSTFTREVMNNKNIQRNTASYETSVSNGAKTKLIF